MLNYIDLYIQGMCILNVLYRRIPLNVEYAMKIYYINLLIHMMNYNVMHVSHI